MGALRSHLSYANIAATIGVFAALSGGAYGAFHVPRNGVRSGNIVDGQVKTADLARGAVTATKVRPASLTPADVALGALSPGARGDPGADGTKGAGGPAGPVVLSTRLIRADDPIDQFGFGLWGLGSGSWTQRAGEVDVALGHVSVTLDAGACTSAHFAHVTGTFDGGSSFTILDTQSTTDQTFVPPLALPAPAADTQHTLSLGINNECSGTTFTVSVLAFDIVRLG